MDSILKELDELYNKQGLNKSNEKTLIKIFKSNDFGILVKKITSGDIELLTGDMLTLVKCAQYIDQYTSEETKMSDYDYDIIYEMLENQMNDIPITVPNISKDNIAYHRYTSLRGTLDKIYDLDVSVNDSEKRGNKSRRGLNQWINTCERKIFEKTGKYVTLLTTSVYGFPKFDGLSIVFEFTKEGTLIRALTRGYTDTNEAKDITHIFKDWKITGPFKNAERPYGLKTEVMVTEEDKNKYNEKYNADYKSSRSLAQAILNSDTADERREMLVIVPLRYSYLDEDGEESLQEIAPMALDNVNGYPYVVTTLDNTEALVEFANSHKYVDCPAGGTLRCDGMVIYIIDKSIQKALGRENNKQKFEVAFKFTEEYAYTKVKDVIFTTGLFGSINPVAKVEPVKMKGNKVKEASLGNYGRFKELALCVGDTVKIGYDIIPYLYMNENIDPGVKRNGGKLIEPPLVCPCCGKSLEENSTGKLLYCRNIDCDINRRGRILNFIQKMDIGRISTATVNDFYEAGYLLTIKDIYKLHKYKKELATLHGYGKKTIQAILNEIDSHRDVEGSTLLGSIGIEGISKKKFSNILTIFDFEELLEICENDEVDKLTRVPGIKDKTATKVIEGIKMNIKLLEFLDKELSITKDREEAETGFKFKAYITKTRDSELSDYVVSKGGKMSESFNKDVTILIVPTKDTTSSKVDKAKKWGIPIITLSEAKQYIDEHF